MRTKRAINAAGVALIKEFEGLRLKAYDDAQPWKKLTKETPLSAIKGTLTIGIGHTGPDVYPGQVISQAEALRLFDRDNDEAEEDVAYSLSGVELSDNMFAACVSLAFNIGGPRFDTSSVAKHLRRGDFTKAADAFKLWNKVKDPATGKLVVSPGLVRRRAAEAALFLTPDSALQPELVPPHMPTTTPAEVEEAPAEADIVKRTVAQVTSALAIPASVWKAAEESGLSGWGLYVLGGIAVVAIGYLLRKQLKRLVLG